MYSYTRTRRTVHLYARTMHIITAYTLPLTTVIKSRATKTPARRRPDRGGTDFLDYCYRHTTLGSTTRGEGCYIAVRGLFTCVRVHKHTYIYIQYVLRIYLDLFCSVVCVCVFFLFMENGITRVRL